MQAATAARLLSLNLQFYQTFGKAFAETRRRIQPGVRRALDLIPPSGRWLDLGCGPGTLAVEWCQTKAPGRIPGVGFQRPAPGRGAPAPGSGLCVPGLQIHFQIADLSIPGWEKAAARPTLRRRAGLCRAAPFARRRPAPAGAGQVHDLLAPGGCFIHSEWQFQHSPKLMARRVPWDRIGLKEEDLEEGDTLLDWRHALVGQSETGRPALRPSFFRA